MAAGQCTPHSLFVLDKKRTGRARSKRKNRYGGSVCASANAPPPAGEGWIYRPSVRLKRVTLGETFGPGNFGILPAPLFAGATLAVAGLGGLPGPGTLRCRAGVTVHFLLWTKTRSMFLLPSPWPPESEANRAAPRVPGQRQRGQEGGASGTSPRLLPDRQPRKRRSETAGVYRAR